ncbi:hypothetical protein BCR44DRAFT_1406657 [Catenaria anguillulae PL171]|uniref:Uncharacterized protein n=1 Tax=Catenaria anguillulae PL171 TaxID=765915 RepID=A0A1Y2H6B8_9FUNG|nr:hypothetical protein BCR44DRAFT_1406657 [Catenaria anguillulae PL171]
MHDAFGAHLARILGPLMITAETISRWMLLTFLGHVMSTDTIVGDPHCTRRLAVLAHSHIGFPITPNPNSMPKFDPYYTPPTSLANYHVPIPVPMPMPMPELPQAALLRAHMSPPPPPTPVRPGWTRQLAASARQQAAPYPTPNTHAVRLLLPPIQVPLIRRMQRRSARRLCPHRPPQVCPLERNHHQLPLSHPKSSLKVSWHCHSRCVAVSSQLPRHLR